MKKPDKGWGQREGFPEEMWLGLKTEKSGEINQGKKGKGSPDGRRPVCREWGWKKQRQEAWAAAEVGATMLRRWPNSIRACIPEAVQSECSI